MKRLLISFLCLMALSAAAFADEIGLSGQLQVGYKVGDDVSSYGIYQTGLGGEFTFNPLTGWLDLSGYAESTKSIGVTGTFQSFCIEYNEHIYPYPAISNAIISTNAVYGGVGAQGDPVSAGTGWLYSQFAQGTLTDYAFEGDLTARKSSADLLQQAIWWLEDEGSILYSAANPYMLAVVTEFGSQGAAKADGGWNFGVYAVNLTVPGTTTRRQDTLYYSAVPDGGASVILLGLAIGGMSLIKGFAKR